MKLKCYTSNVHPNDSIAAMERILIAAGVTGIAKDYGEDRAISAITFKINFDSAVRVVRIPAKVKEATDAFWKEYEDAHPKEWLRQKSRADFEQQGARTAWRIALNWLEIQLSMIQLQQADFEQVFLGYLWDGQKTSYDRIKENGYRALLPETTET